MSDLPYTDADLRAEAARYVSGEVDGLEIPLAMAERAPWSSLCGEAWRAALAEVIRLVEGAADVSEWAVNLGADGLEPSTSRVLSMNGGDKPFARLHFAFHPDMSEANRDQFVMRLADLMADAG